MCIRDSVKVLLLVFGLLIDLLLSQVLVRHLGHYLLFQVRDLHLAHLLLLLHALQLFLERFLSIVSGRYQVLRRVLKDLNLFVH